MTATLPKTTSIEGFAAERLRPGDTAKPDLNGASATELMRINGIGPALAERIIAGRPYRSFDEVGRVEGISASLLAALRQACMLGAD